MKNTFGILMILLTSWSASFSAQAQEPNRLLDREFWRNQPSLEMVQGRIQAGDDATALDKYDFDALSWALIENAPVDILRHLLTLEGNDVNKLTHDARTYVFWAAYRDNLAFVRELHDLGADLSIVDEHGYSLLNFAAVTGQTNKELYQYLKQHGADPFNELNHDGAHALLLLAPFLRDWDLVMYFEESGLSLSDKDKNGASGFLYACKGGNVEFLRELVAEGMFEDSVDNLARNGAHYAAMSTRRRTNGVEVFSFLHELGLRLDLADHEGVTPLMIYVQGKSEPDGLAFLAGHTENLNALDKSGYSAMHHALSSGNPEDVQGLIDAGWKSNPALFKPESLVRALASNYASRNHDSFMSKIQMLRAEGVNPNQLLDNGESWFHLGARTQSMELLKFAALQRLEINQVSEEGMTPLLEACLTATNVDVLNWLVSVGADVAQTTPFGETAHDLAMENEALVSMNLDFLKP